MIKAKTLRPDSEPRLPRTRNPIAKRRQIMAAAIKLFARQGFERTTTREIAQAARVAEGTIYSHFPSKHDILLASFKSHALEPVVAILAEGAGQDEHEILQALTRNRIEMFGKLKDVARVMFGEAIFNPRVARLLRHELHEGLARIREFVEERKEAGRFRSLDAEVVARLIMSMFFGTFILWGFIAGDFPRRLTPDQLEATLPEFVLHGLLAGPPIRKGGRSPAKTGTSKPSSHRHAGKGTDKAVRAKNPPSPAPARKGSAGAARGGNSPLRAPPGKNLSRRVRSLALGRKGADR